MPNTLPARIAGELKIARAFSVERAGDFPLYRGAHTFIEPLGL